MTGETEILLGIPKPLWVLFMSIPMKPWIKKSRLWKDAKNKIDKMFNGLDFGAM